MTKYIYLSYFISEETPLYGGSSNIKIQQAKSIRNGDSSNTKLISFPNHVSTHIDFPSHFSDSEKTIDDYEPSTWIFNRPYFIEKKVEKDEIIDLDKELDEIPIHTDFLIIKTGFSKYRGTDTYWKHNPGLNPKLAKKIQTRLKKLKAVGIDTISVSGYQNRELGRLAHREFLISNRLLLIEDMNLIQLHTQLNKIYCFPLLIHKTDGSPVTVIAEVN